MIRIKNIKRLQFIGFIFSGVLGTILHFAYEWSGNMKLLAPFSGINESIWEHMKLLFFPLLLFAWAESYFLEKEYTNFWSVKCTGIYLGVFLIPIIYYTCLGVFGTSPDWFNITIFFICDGIAFWVETKLFFAKFYFNFSKFSALLFLYILLFLFIIFTFYPPNLPLFWNPKK